MRLVALDFEASCLPRHGRSYPIEVGISEDGERARSWLIGPHPSWSGWTWTEEAERLHGISRAELALCGEPAERVAADLTAALSGARVVADSDIDAYWLDTLYAAAGQPPPATVHHVREILDERELDSDAIFAAIARVDARALRRHRAGDDARWLAAVLRELGAIEPAAPHPLFGRPASAVVGVDRQSLAA